MRILITGSAGYIGTNLIEHFKNSDSEYALTGLDTVNGSAQDAAALPLAVPAYDCIVHLAAYPGVVNCDKNPHLAYYNNIATASRVFNIALLHPSVKVVFISSLAAKDPGANYYANLKHICENMAYACHSKGANITVLRLTNVFGGIKFTSSKNTVIAQLARAILNNSAFTIHGDGSHIRNFVHVKDVCYVIEYATQHKSKRLMYSVFGPKQNTVPIYNLPVIAGWNKVEVALTADPGVMTTPSCPIPWGPKFNAPVPQLLLKDYLCSL